MSAAEIARNGSVVIHVRLTPKAASNAVDGIGEAADGRRHLKLRVRAVPEKGRANESMIALLAAHFGIPKTAITIVAGASARLKTVRLAVDGPKAEEIAAACMAR